jgi:hypothetical protein
MATLAAGASTTVTVPAKQVLTTVGQGTAVMGPGQGAGVPNGLINTEVLGPFPVDRIVYLSANAGTSLDYSVALPASASPTSSSSLSAPTVNRAWRVPNGWGARYKAKLANAGSQLVRIAGVGDSIMHIGAVSSIHKTQVALAAAAARAKYGDGGSGFIGLATSSLASSSPTSVTGFWAFTGTWGLSVAVPDGPGATVAGATTVGATATNTVRGTSVSVYVCEDNTATRGSYNITIDGTTYGPYSTNQPTKGIGVRTISGLSAGNHTVTVTSIDADGSTKFFAMAGMRGFNNAGVVYDNYSRSGFSALAFSNTTPYSYTLNPYGTFGASAGNFGFAGQWSGGSKNPADLIVFGHGINNESDTPDTYLSYVRGYLDDALDGAGANGADILFVVNHRGTSGFGTAGKPFGSLMERLYGLADVYGAAVVNFWAAGYNSSQFMIDNGYLGAVGNNPPGTAGADPVHPGDAGHTWESQFVIPLLDGTL